MTIDTTRITVPSAIVTMRTENTFRAAIGEEKFGWDLRIPLTRDIDIFNVEDKIGERKRWYELPEEVGGV